MPPRIQGQLCRSRCFSHYVNSAYPYFDGRNQFMIMSVFQIKNQADGFGFAHLVAYLQCRRTVRACQSQTGHILIRPLIRDMGSSQIFQYEIPPAPIHVNAVRPWRADEGQPRMHHVLCTCNAFFIQRKGCI